MFFIEMVLEIILMVLKVFNGLMVGQEILESRLVLVEQLVMLEHSTLQTHQHM